MEGRKSTHGRAGQGSLKLVNTTLVISLSLLGILIVSFLVSRKSLKRLVRGGVCKCSRC